MRARRTRPDFVASQPGSTKKRHWQPPHPTRRDSTEHSESASPPLPPPPVDLATQQQQKFTEHARKYAVAILKYTVKVVADAFHFCRRFFSYALGIVILWLLFSMVASQLVFFARPVCSLPIVSYMAPFCRWEVFKGPSVRTSNGKPIHWADYPKLVDVQTRTFDQLLDESIGNKGLTSEVKKAEMASNDLMTLVKMSDLKGRDQVVAMLGRFVDDARETGRSLHSLGAKIHGAVDS